MARPLAPSLEQAEHLRTWPMQASAEWTELSVAADLVQYFQAQLPGVHAGVALRFVVRLSQRRAGWYYQLTRFEVRSPTSLPEVVYWLPLHRLLDAPDFSPHVWSVQQQVQLALPRL